LEKTLSLFLGKVARSDGRVKKYHLPLWVLLLETGGELILEKNSFPVFREGGTK